MDASPIPEALSERLGIEATAALVDLFGRMERHMTETILTRSVDRFERCLVTEISKLRVEMLHGDGVLKTEIQTLRADLHNQKFELLKWSFLFWVGQVVTIATLFQLTER